MFGTIVVGTDGSQSAQRAVEHAVAIACATRAQLHIVSAFDDGAMTAAAAAGSPLGAGLVETYARLIPHLQQAAETVVAEAAALAGDLRVSTHAVPGDAADALISIAEDQSADAIVVGNKGMGSASRFLLGSVPNRVAHHASCHVLIVHTT